MPIFVRQTQLEMEDVKQRVAELIKEAREKKGVSQTELASILGVTRATANGYETGKQNLTIETLQKVAGALNIPLKIIFG